MLILRPWDPAIQPSVLSKPCRSFWGMVSVSEPLLKQRNLRESRCQAQRKFKKTPSTDGWSLQRLISLCCIIVVNAPPTFPPHCSWQPAWGPWERKVLQKMIRATDCTPHSQREHTASAIPNALEKNELHTRSIVRDLFSELVPALQQHHLGPSYKCRFSGFTPGCLWRFQLALQVVLSTFKSENHRVRALGLLSQSCLKRAATNSQGRRGVGI